MKLQRFWKVSVCIMMLVVVVLGNNTVKAQEEKVATKGQVLSTDLTAFNLQLEEVETDLKITFTIEGNKTGISNLSLNVESGDKNTEYLTTSELIFLENNTYTAKISLKGLEQKLYEVTSVNLTDVENNSYSFSKSCVNNSEDQYCASSTSDLLKDKWDTLKVTGKRTASYPTITSLQGKNFGDIEVGNTVLDLNYDLDNVSDFENIMVTLNYKMDNGKSYSLYYQNGVKKALLLEAIKYQTKKLKLDYIVVSGEIKGVMVNNRMQTIYTPLSKEEFEQENTMGGFMNTQFENISTIMAEDSLDINIINYANDTTPPSIVSADWRSDTINLPGDLILDFKVDNNENESEVSLIMPITSRSLKFNPGQQYIYNQNEFRYSLGRYEDLTSMKTYGFVAYDSCGNAAYYLTDPNAVKNNSYYGEYIPDGAIIREWKQSFKDVSFKRTQNYEQILDNTKDYLSILRNAKSGSLFVVDTNVNANVDEKVFDAIKGKDITLVFENVTGYATELSGVQWIVNGKDIKNIKSIDTSVSIKANNLKVGEIGAVSLAQPKANTSLIKQNEYVLASLENSPELSYYSSYLKSLDILNVSYYDAFWEAYQKDTTVRLDFAENGELPGKMRIRFKMDYTFRNYISDEGLSLFYVNEDKLDLVQSGISLDTESYYGFDLTHNSSYLLKYDTTNQPKVDSPVNSPTITTPTSKSPLSPSTGDASNINMLVFIMTICVGVICLFIRKTKSHNRLNQED